MEKDKIIYLNQEFNSLKEQYGKYKIVEILPYNMCKILFLNTNNSKEIRIEKAIKGEVFDELADRLKKDSIWKSNTCGNFKIVRYVDTISAGERYEVEFLNTKYRNIFLKNNIKKGKINDNSLTTLKIGDIFKTNNCGELEIIEYIEKNIYRYKFLRTGYINKAQKYLIELGELKDPYYPSVCNKGYFGEGIFNSKEHKSIYSCWQKIINRCYNPKDKMFKDYGALGVITSDYFLNFQNFADWYFKELKKYKSDIKLELDKDIIYNIIHINKQYSEKTCMLIPNYLNGYLAGDNIKSGIEFQQNKDYISYFARIKDLTGTRKTLGTFKSFEEAKIAYAKEKKKYWLELLEQYKNILPKEYYNLCLQYDFSWGLLKS